jgi:hypothetical protein
VCTLAAFNVFVPGMFSCCPAFLPASEGELIPTAIISGLSPRNNQTSKTRRLC